MTMTKRTWRNPPCARPALFLFLVCLLLTLPATAQSQDGNSSGGNSTAPRRYQPAGVGGQLVRETREAAGEGDDNGEFKHAPSVRLIARLTGLSLEHAYWLCVILNFAVVAGVILWLSRKRLPGIFQERTNAIQKAMREAHQASTEANQRLAEIEARLSRLDAEIGNMRSTAEKEAAAEEARIQAGAAEETRKIISSAEEEIGAAALAARRELSAYAANLAVSLASRQIHVDAATDQALVREFAQQIPAAPNGGSPARKKSE